MTELVIQENLLAADEADAAQALNALEHQKVHAEAQRQALIDSLRVRRTGLVFRNF